MNSAKYFDHNHYQAAFNRNRINHLLLSHKFRETRFSTTWKTPGHDLSNLEGKSFAYYTSRFTHLLESIPLSRVPISFSNCDQPEAQRSGPPTSTTSWSYKGPLCAMRAWIHVNCVFIKEDLKIHERRKKKPNSPLPLPQNNHC